MQRSQVDAATARVARWRHVSRVRHRARELVVGRLQRHAAGPAAGVAHAPDPATPQVKGQ